MSVAPAAREAITNLYGRYGLVLDTDRLEDWVALFTEDAQYKIITRENVDAGLEGGLLYCDGRDMLADRVAYIRKAAIYNIHRDRHLIGTPVITARGPGLYDASASFVVYQSEPDRDSRVFCVGCYEDIVREVDGAFLFQSKLVMLDNDSITPLLSTPL